METPAFAALLTGLSTVSAGNRVALRDQPGLTKTSNGASVFLIRKDRGIKAAQRGCFGLERFPRLIKTMPMRREERRGR